jgi:hypothetical protein
MREEINLRYLVVPKQKHVGGNNIIIIILFVTVTDPKSRR